MLFDNLFPTLGPIGTAGALLVILGAFAIPAVGALACPAGVFRRSLPRGR